MPRFYFDVREGTRLARDDDGLLFDTLDGVEREAAKAAAEIGKDTLPQGDAREVTVEVRNEHGQQVLTIVVAMSVYRVDPAPTAPAA